MAGNFAISTSIYETDDDMDSSVFSFVTAQEIRFGRGAAMAAAAAIAGMGDKVFVVHGSDAMRAGWLLAVLDANGVQRATFACNGEPDMAMIEAGVAGARAAGARVVVALGGGAAIDTGKAIAALVPSGRPMMDHLEVVGKGLPLVDDPLPFVAIPTTAGTGAEVTKNAVITVPEHQRKVSLRDVRMLPNLAIIDPALTDNTPRSVTLASGLDAVTQVIEPYVSCKANRISDALTRDAIPQGIRALVHLMQGENAAARDDLAWVSLCGGLALANAGLGAVHGLAGVVGGLSGAPHGAICGVLLPHVLQANADSPEISPRTASRLAEVQGWVGDALGVEPGGAFASLADWSRHHGLPGLGDMGVRASDHGKIASDAGLSSSMKGNPVRLSVETLAGILGAAV